VILVGVALVGHWFYGKAGVGKSHKVFMDMCNVYEDQVYVKEVQDEWWDGYEGETVLIINEYRAEIKYSELLSLCDKWPKKVKTSGACRVYGGEDSGD